MKTQIVYVLVANDTNLYLEELWVSLYSLRLFHPKTNTHQDLLESDCAHVKVLVDEQTNNYMLRFHELVEMIDEIVVVSTPDGYNAKERSRQIKTTIRNVIEGAYLFIDTDTVICKPLNGVDSLTCDVAAVPDGHVLLKDYPFYKNTIGDVRYVFGADASESKYWFNSGVMYVADTPKAHELYRQWNKNWTHSCFEKAHSQDQPALLMTNMEMGYPIEELLGTYNAQVAMSIKYFADAKIVHFWHMEFIPDQSYSPYFSLEIYKELKNRRTITPEIRDLIIHCKSSFTSPSMPVGKDQMYFLFSKAGKDFVQIYKDGGVPSALMLRCANWIIKLHDFLKNRKHN